MIVQGLDVWEPEHARGIRTRILAGLLPVAHQRRETPSASEAHRNRTCGRDAGARPVAWSGRFGFVVALDLSQSEAVKGHDAQAEFQKNVDAVTQIVATLPAGARVNVIGIKDYSFAMPYIILCGQLTSAPGYFHERLANGRAALVRVWRQRSARLAPRYPQTDILGALLVASQIFREGPQRCQMVLVVLSDMKQAIRALNIEHQPLIRTKLAMQRVDNTQQLAALMGVHVYIEGVNGAGESVAYWKSLR